MRRVPTPSLPSAMPLLQSDLILLGHNVAALEQDAYGALKDLLTHLRCGVNLIGRRVIAHLEYSTLRLEQIIQTLCRSGHSVVTLAADYSAEVDAVLEIYDLAMGGVNSFREEDIQTLIDSAMKSDAIYNTVIVLGDSGKVLFKIETEDQREFMIDAIEDYYDESEKTEKEHKLFMAFATAIGLDKDIELN